MEPDNSDRLQWIIEHRHSTRAPFDPAQTVSERELARIVDAARWAPTAHNMQNFRLVVVDDRRVLDELGRIRAPISPRFIADNFHHLAWSREELEAKKVGLLGTMFPRAWWSDDPAKVPQDASRLLGDVIAGAPLVILVLYDPAQPAPGEHGDAEGLISLGCVLENMWLAAQACHLDVQVASTFASPGAEPEVKRVLGVPAPWRIAFGLRVGHAVATRDALRVRRDPEMFVHRNRF